MDNRITNDKLNNKNFLLNSEQDVQECDASKAK